MPAKMQSSGTLNSRLFRCKPNSESQCQSPTNIRAFTNVASIFRYELKNEKEKFRIDPNTGEMVTKAKLDREERSEYELVVVASDSSLTNARTAQVSVIVHVNDVNDHPPVFREMLDIVYVPDNIEPGQFVVGASAADADIGLNGKIIYQLFGDDASKFSINQDTGVIKASTSLAASLSKLTNFKLEIRASDSGTSSLSSTNIVEIRLRPADQFPVVRSEAKSFTFSEQIENRVFTSVTATSPKAGAAGEIQYGIAGGNTGEIFQVNAKTGEVSIGKGLDFEITNQYELWIEARDSDETSLASVTRLLINVTDFNDNTPVFDHVIYYASILEEQFPPSPLMASASPRSGADHAAWENRALLQVRKDFNFIAHQG